MELEVDSVVDDDVIDDLVSAEHDEYDVRFDEMKEIKLNSKKNQIDGEMKAARLQVDDAR